MPSTELTLTGKLLSILPKQEGDTKTGGRWQRQSFLLEVRNGNYVNTVCLDMWGDRINLLAPYHEGDTIAVSFDVSSREFSDRWYTSLQVWKILPASANSQQSATTQAQGNAQAGQSTVSQSPATEANRDDYDSLEPIEMQDDLPF